ncbi:hypothetical protein OH77DRAFT_648068 [Trametes cingulata]|nr:hypothetical protein OH77DRAFT_648068 [Trametes cingulata]
MLARARTACRLFEVLWLVRVQMPSLAVLPAQFSCNPVLSRTVKAKWRQNHCASAQESPPSHSCPSVTADASKARTTATSPQRACPPPRRVGLCRETSVPARPTHLPGRVGAVFAPPNDVLLPGSFPCRAKVARKRASFASPTPHAHIACVLDEYWRGRVWAWKARARAGQAGRTAIRRFAWGTLMLG